MVYAQNTHVAKLIYKSSNNYISITSTNTSRVIVVTEVVIYIAHFYELIFVLL